MHVILVTQIIGEEVTIEQRSRLALVFASSVRIVNVKSKSQSPVDIRRKMGFKAFLTVTSVSLFVVSQIGIR